MKKSAGIFFILSATMRSGISLTFIILLFISISICSCGGAKKKSSGTHTHEDGTEHQDHPVEPAPAIPAQETFKVEADSTTSTANPAHDHGNGQLHDHGDGKPHKH
jgi:hypothetical protein